MKIQRKYVKLNQELTEWVSPLMNVKPNPVKRHADEKLHTFNWFVVEEEYAPLPDSELYTYDRTGWTVEDDDILGRKVVVHYEPILRDVETCRSIMCKRVDQKRDQNMRGGLSFNGNRIDTDEITVVRVIGLALKAVIDPTIESQFITQDNRIINLNATDIIQLGQAFGVFETQNVMLARKLKDLILSSDEPEDVNILVPSENVGISEDWPTGEF